MSQFEILMSGPAKSEQAVRSALMNAGVGADDFVPAHHGYVDVDSGKLGWVAFRADDLSAAEKVQSIGSLKWRHRITRHAERLVVQPEVPGPKPAELFQEWKDGLEGKVATLEQLVAQFPLPSGLRPVSGGALESPAYVISADYHSADLFRQAAQSGLASAGVVGSSDLAVSPSSGLTVSVAAGQVWMPGTVGGTTGFPTNYGNQTSVGNTNGGTTVSTGFPTSFTKQGSYFAYQDAAALLTLTTADPTLYRIDLVCASVQDAEWAGSSNQAVLQVVTGSTGSSGSVAPTAPPANSVVVASIWVPPTLSTVTSGDINNLAPAFRGRVTGQFLSSQGSAFSASSGTAYLCTGGGYTATLPTPAFGSTITFTAGTGVSGSSPVTISAGANGIYGLAGGIVSTVLLGAPGASITLAGNNASAWYVVAGQQDTGWVPITLATHWSAGSSTTPAWRLIGDRVWLEGEAVLASGAFTITSLGTVGSAAEPPVQRLLNPFVALGMSSTYTAPGLTIAASSTTLSIGINGGSSGSSTISLDGLSYGLT